jgi:hypothetical protein
MGEGWDGRGERGKQVGWGGLVYRSVVLYNAVVVSESLLVVKWIEIMGACWGGGCACLSAKLISWSFG